MICTKHNLSQQMFLLPKIKWGISPQNSGNKLMNTLKRIICSQAESYTEASAFTSVRTVHIPVMTKEVIERLNPVNGHSYVDMTFGAGGHTTEILKQAPGAKIFALDRDPVAFNFAKKMAGEGLWDIIPLHGKFSDLPSLFGDIGIKPNSVDGFIFDVGASSMQFDSESRGFSLSKDGPLDMRMNDQDPITAADVVNHLDVKELQRIISHYGEEKLAKKIAVSIVEARQVMGKIETTKQLADIIATVLPGINRDDKLKRHAHVATKTFQALRIFVNDELNELHNGLETAHHFLKPMGQCVIITFHSLEDRLVKLHFKGIALDVLRHKSARDWARENPAELDAEKVQELTQKRWCDVSQPVSPSEDEVAFNPRSRSAKLRAAKKVI